MRNGYVVGATVKDVGLTTNDTLWTQDMDNLAGGLNGKFKVGDWKVDADLASSRAGRDSQWRDLRQFAKANTTITWAFTGNEHQSYSYGFDTGNPALFGAPTLYVDADGHLDDKLNGQHLSASRHIDSSLVSTIKFGARVTDREKSYHQTTWNIAPLSAIPDSAYQAVNVAGFAPFLALKDFGATTSNIKENIPTVNPYPVEGLMKHNGGVTLWYEQGGYEARVSANYHSAFVRNPTWGAGQLILNRAETWVGLTLAKQLTPHLQLRFGIDNLGNQKVVYTAANNPFQQEVTEFGRRFNLGLSFKL